MTSSPSNNSAPDSDTNSSGTLDQVRDLLFGRQIDEYSGRFERLEDKFNHLEQSFNTKLDGLQRRASDDLAAAVEELEQRLQGLSRRADDDSADTRQQIERLQQRFNSRVTELEEQTSQRLNTVREDLASAKDAVMREIQSLKSEVMQYVDRHINQLENSKVSNHQLADLFFELGVKLKGTDVLSEINAHVEGTTPAEPHNSQVS